ncbi:hypothetical protein LS48_01945 [Aequorivita aquimaris]|uniref:Uncharacterized protein n=2 Tax=Aequorivita aquimaris TaxID=1548749 RepID=A0A137RM28_9FLAO|nr:hypothetical protein LS48_01945 [Aequorivita aquimaris]
MGALLKRENYFIHLKSLTMKTKITFLGLVIFTSLLTNCTPNALIDETSAQTPPIYNTGGEHSAEPDNDKD